MQAARAIKVLTERKDEADRRGMELRPPGQFASWKGRVTSTFIRALGKDHHLISDFDNVQYSLMTFSDGTPASAFDRAFLEGL
jgi:hypothetical protein